MMNKRPLRLTTLHFAQRLRMDGETFMITFLLTLTLAVKYSQSIDYTHFSWLVYHRTRSSGQGEAA
jgi:hypothetical protein